MKSPQPVSLTPFHRTLLALLAVGGLSASAISQTIPNPSFEADNFTVFPGYVSGNGPITGWTGTPANRTGLNPAGGSPFANNGAIPDGSRVAFIQSATDGPTTLSTEITGLTPGETYTVNFRFNARTNNPAQTPFLKIGLDGQRVVGLSTMGVQIGGTTTPYRYAAFDFTASAASHTLWLTNDVSGDTTVLVDNFSINISTNGWSYAPWTDDASSGVDNTKNYTHAYNFGGNSAPNVTINGVTFRGLVGANPNVPNEFRVAGLGSAFTSDDANNVTGSSAVLADRFIYGGNSGTFSIFGLVPGMEYVATFYSVGWQDSPQYLRAQTFSRGSERMTVNQDHFGDNQGIRISYRYIAPPSGSILLSQTPTLSGSTLHLYGFANHEANVQHDPVVGLQPRSQVTTPGATASFRVTAGGARPLFFQWYKDGTALTDETNATLTVNNLTPADAGPYWVTVSNEFNVVTSSSATLTFGMIANPSFEADLFNNWPGYVSGNHPISGWTGSDPARVGLNPLADGQGPFANTGTVPDGAQAAFIQSAGPVTLSTPITGLTPGENYVLNFRANARDYNNTRPTLRVAIDGEQIGEARLHPVGGTSPYRSLAFPFTPTSETVALILTNDTTDTAVVDDFSVEARTTQWSYAAWTDDASSGIDSAHGYSHAYNFGGAGLGVDTTINGVRFVGVPGANPGAAGQFVSAGLTGAFGADANNVVSAGGGGAALGQSFVYYSGTIPADAVQSITLSNLVPGVEYVATIYGVAFDPKSYARSATFSANNDQWTINEDHFGQDNGIRVSYRYVADASGTLTLNYVPTDRASSFHTYGFSNEELNSTTVPLVYRQPQGRTVSGGATVVIDGLVGGQPPLSLQWQKNGVALQDETNAVLTLLNVNGSDTGDYTLVVSNALGVITSAVAQVEVGLALANPSFEADVFTNYPGYIAGNFPITGWASSLPVQTGINPVSDGRSPFADTGAIPDGTKVAFIQADGGTLSQVITGMTPGATYYVKFYENARGGGRPLPSLAVTLGGETIVPTHVVNAGAYVRVESGPFLATSDSAELVFIKSPGPTGGDSTVVIDNVAVLDLPPTAPYFLVQPQSAYVTQGETISLVSLAQGTLPIAYQWQRDGNDLPDATDSTLEFPGITLGQAGTYRVVVSNSLGMATSEVAQVRVGLRITELFDTGVDDYGALLPAQAVDPHYQLVSSADPAFPGPAALVLNDAWPIPPYMTNGPISKWIGPRLNDPAGADTSAANVLDGLYTYRTAFVLDTTDPATAEIRGKWAMDNLGVDILLNGVSLGISNNAGFATFSTFVISSGFVAGYNTLDFVISNSPPPGPTAVRIELYGVAEPLPPTAPQIVAEPQDQLVTEMGNAMFAVVATGSAPLAYQWYFESPLLPGELFDLPDETNRVLRLNGVAADQAGQYSVVITNSEGSVTSAVATLIVNQSPVANRDDVSAVQDLALSIGAVKLLDNDSDPDGDALGVTSVSATSTNGGTVTLSEGVVTYTPPAGYVGPDAFSYVVTDARGASAVGEVVVNVVTQDSGTLNIVQPPTLLPNGHFQVRFAGIPNYTYHVDRATDVNGPWEFFMDITAGPDGLFELDDPNDPPEPMRFYRTRFP